MTENSLLLASYANPVLTIILAVLGWFFIYKNGNRLANRNEAHSLFKLTRDLVSDIYIEAEKAWKDDIFKLPEHDEHKLATLCAELEQCISQLEKYYSTNVDGVQIFRFRQALTKDKKLSSQHRLKEIKSKSSEISTSLLLGAYSHVN